VLSAGVALADPPRPIGLVLPSQQPGWSAWTERVRLMADGGGRSGEVAADPQLSAQLARAEALFGVGNLDEAATILDGALADGGRKLDRLADPAPFLSAHVTRASIAFARGEAGRAQTVLEHLSRYDPAFVLAPTENSPQLRAALERARAEVAAAPLRPSDVVELCGGARLIVARLIGGDRVELARFDDCREVATTLATGATRDAELTARLFPRPAGSEPRRRRSAGAARWVGPTLLGLGAAAAISGAVLLGVTAHDYDHLVQTCKPAGCPDDQVDRVGARATVSYALLGVGGAVAVTGIAVWLYHATHGRKAATVATATEWR
jgi:hypothetical protein